MNLRPVYAFTIFFVIFHVTMVTSDAGNRDCDAEECDAECKYRLKKDHGECHRSPKNMKGPQSCICYSEPDSFPGVTTRITWCKDEKPDYRCLPIFNRNTPNCSFTDCENSCSSRYEGPEWQDVGGTCKRAARCRCIGKQISKPEYSDYMLFID